MRLKWFPLLLFVLLAVIYIPAFAEEVPSDPVHVHEYTGVVVRDATHLNDGLVVYQCSCGDSYEKRIPAQGHSFFSLTIAPTCTENGAQVLRCSVCGMDEVVHSPETDPDAVELLAKGHRYVETQRTEPTTEKDGSITYLCLNCGDTYTSILAHEEFFVAQMYVCAKRQFSPLGHMWIYIQNTSDHPLQVGAYEVPAGEGVSVGTFALTRSDGWGIYYNVEAFCLNKYGMKSLICLEQKLTEAQLQKISQRIRNGNYWTLILYNCMGSAFSIWNAGPGQKLIPLLFPALGRLEMLVYPHDTEIKMYYPTENQVFKQRGNGENAVLEKVRNSTLANGI